MRLAFFISILFLISSCSKHEKLLGFSGEFKLSTDVAHFIYVQTIPRVINGETCDYPVKEYEVIKTFKGELKQGELIRVLATGIESKGDESILLLYRQNIKDYRVPNDCVIDRIKKYKSVILSYVINNEPNSNKSVVFFEMPDSETRGPDILISLSDVYSKLEEFGEKYSNKSLKQDK
jgi:hypothetical protein